MKDKKNQGFSLIETLIAIALLSALVIPTCSSMIMSFRINGRTDDLMKAQLAVSSAVEILMAEGISGESNQDYGTEKEPGAGENGEAIEIIKSDRFPDVIVATTKDSNGLYYTVTVTSNDGLVAVTTTIRAKIGGQP